MRQLPDRKGLGTFIWEPTQNGNRQALFTPSARGFRGNGNTPGTPSPTAPRPGAVIPEKMAAYDQMISDYGLRKP
jgi:hypothetical protein